MIVVSYVPTLKGVIPVSVLSTGSCLIITVKNRILVNNRIHLLLLSYII